MGKYKICLGGEKAIPRIGVDHQIGVRRRKGGIQEESLPGEEHRRDIGEER